MYAATLSIISVKILQWDADPPFQARTSVSSGEDLRQVLSKCLFVFLVSRRSDVEEQNTRVGWKHFRRAEVGALKV